MRVEQLIESRPATLDLTKIEAVALAKAGRRLASTKSWWGESDSKATDRSVIHCRPASGGKWRVTVQDAVGIVSVGHLQLVIQPKIPQSHLLYLLEAGEHIPRMDDERGYAESGASLWQLVATWYVQAAERVLRRDLLRDYSEQSDFLSAKRGRVVALPTARAFYSGRMGFECQFEDFTVDTPLNRVLKAAAIAVIGSKNLSRALRRRAQAVRARMHDVGDLVREDIRVNLDRRAGYYADAIQLARHILRSQGRVLAAGELSAWTFLIRTPEMIEDGLRNVLIDKIGGKWSIEKRRIQVASGISFTPDLVFAGGRIIADVKYKLLRSNWNRADLYQIVAFGTAFRATHAAVFGFEHPDLEELPKRSTVGPIKIECLAWPANPNLRAAEAADVFKQRVDNWLESTDVGNEYGVLNVAGMSGDAL